ncbi:Methyltransferase domain protein [Legionella massiliensis]|uniref:Methyltransferase domain protein n=1 Tax=Legionella massiliensis TaxID=1034943 RepID=A0A078KZE1_9GAMM|nr:class I SAM-dependent methyltransferase [Legionella massiliensis]CDZ77113.1 Methyltransferase domain protein [Legionella massiliensis]CEE12851.1 Methyltransferase domain protein [Legionella massiliensis]
MKKFDTYQNLCTEVYELSKPEAPEDAYRFYRSYAAESQGLILEPMCGTGRFLLALLEEGFAVHGFDASRPMLASLAAKAQAKGITPRVWHGFVEELQGTEKYDLIFIPSGSFGLLTELSTIRAALETFYEYLTNDGVLVFEVETRRAVPEELGVWRGSSWQRADGKLILLSQLALLEGEICTSIGKYELVDANAIVQTEVEVYKIRIYDNSLDMFNLLDEIGFRQVRVVKAFEREGAIDETDDCFVYECRRGG